MGSLTRNLPLLNKVCIPRENDPCWDQRLLAQVLDLLPWFILFRLEDEK